MHYQPQLWNWRRRCSCTCGSREFCQSSSQPGAFESRRVWCALLHKSTLQWCVSCISLNTCRALPLLNSQRWIFAPVACSNSTSLPPNQVHVGSSTNLQDFTEALLYYANFTMHYQPQLWNWRRRRSCTCGSWEFCQSSSQPGAFESGRVWCAWLHKSTLQWCVSCVSLNTCRVLPLLNSKKWIFAPVACSNSTSLPPNQVHVGSSKS